MLTSRPLRDALLIALIACWVIPGSGSSQTTQEPSEVHPKKAVYTDRMDWPATAPGEVSLANFQPFRAVYDRQYRQHSGPNAGDIRRDRVIISAEEVGWDGRRAVSITLIDSGIAAQADTNARALVQIADLESLELLFEIGPTPGKAKDYYLARAEPDQILFSQVVTDAQTFNHRKHSISAPGFGPGTWVMASMNLEADAKVRLAPYYSSKANVVSATDYGRVLGKQTLTDGSGSEHEAWVVETGGYYSPTNPKVQHIYLIARPPYYLGTENVHLDTGERNRFVWLRSAQTFADEADQP